MTNHIALNQAFEDIRCERERQTELWGDQWKPGSIDPFRKVAIATEELLEIVRDVNDNEGKETVELHGELIQLAAVLVAWIESLEIEEVKEKYGT